MSSTTRQHLSAAALAVAVTIILFTAAAGQVGERGEAETETVVARAESGRVAAPARRADPERASGARVAAALRSAAAELYDDPARWDAVAVYHAHAALLSGFEGRAALEDLALAGNLFWRLGERRLACATLRKAALLTLRNGDVREADRAFRRANRAGSPDCVRQLEGILIERIVAAPAVVRVEAPDLEAVDVEEVRIRRVLRRPELSRPPLGTRAVAIPPAPGPIRVEPPTIELPDLQDVKIAPVLRRPVTASAAAGESGGTR